MSDWRLATLSDVVALLALVNSAYRGQSSRAGWTTEADLLDGQRTDAQELSALLHQADSCILLQEGAQGLIGCVHLHRRDAHTAYLGMLVIRPDLQRQGLGHRLLHAAETHARSSWGVDTMQMQVISCRHELLAWYERRGYRRSGETLPFPDDPRCGLPRVPGLQFAVLRKALAA
ncbi:MAG: GNAT family N-acetyltransferase [Pseudomonadota bacterium]